MKRLIKKQLVYSSIMFLSFSLAQAAVDSQNDEGTRQIVEKVGTTVEQIAEYTGDTLSLLDNLDLFVQGCSICSPTVISSVPYIINQSGAYVFESDLTLTTTEISPAITIDADEVVLCLCDKVLAGPIGSTGISVEDDHTNVLIRNGLVTTFSTGITVGTGCENIKIEDVDVVDCELIAMELVAANPIAVRRGLVAHCYRGIRVTGEDTGQVLLEDLNITDCEYEGLILTSTTVIPLTSTAIKHCSVTKTATAMLSSGEKVYAVYLNTCRGILVADCSFSDNGNVANNTGHVRVLGLVGCSNCEIKDTQANRNEGSSFLSAFYLSESSENVFDHCYAVENIILNSAAPASFYSIYGFNVIDSSDANIFAYCYALSNSVQSAATSLSNYSSRGFFSDSNSGNIYLDCAANNQYANATLFGGLDSLGFSSLSDEGFQYIRCIAAGNYSGENCYGFHFLETGALKGEIKDCQSLHNDGLSSGYGFYITLGVASKTPLFIRNIACQNSTANYQSFGGYEFSAPISSPANARGVDNVDCDLTDEDSIDVIESNVFEMNSKVLVIDSLVDELAG